MIHQPEGSTPSAPGSVLHRTPPSRSAACSRSHRMRALSTPTTMAGTAIARSRRGVTFGSVSGIARLIFGQPFVVPRPGGSLSEGAADRPRTAPGALGMRTIRTSRPRRWERVGRRQSGGAVWRSRCELQSGAQVLPDEPGRREPERRSSVPPTADAAPNSSATTVMPRMLASAIRTGRSAPSGSRSWYRSARYPMPSSSRVSSAVSQSTTPVTSRPSRSRARKPSPSGTIQPTASPSARRCSIHSVGSTDASVARVRRAACEPGAVRSRDTMQGTDSVGIRCRDLGTASWILLSGGRRGAQRPHASADAAQSSSRRSY